MSPLLRVVLLSLGLFVPLDYGIAQTASSLADLRWSVAETTAGRFVIVPGQRSFVGGYSTPGLEVWAYPMQLVRNYWVSFRLDGDTAEIDGRTLLHSVEHTPTAAMRLYEGRDFSVREYIWTPVDLPAAWIRYRVEANRPVLVRVHFTPSLNLMWPGAIGGQEIHWDATHSGYMLDEPSRRFRGAIVSRQVVAHEQIRNDRTGGDFERSVSFTLRVLPGATGEARVAFAGSSTADEVPISTVNVLEGRHAEYATRGHARYTGLQVVDVTTPDSNVNRALKWAQVTLEQAWVCNPQLGCGLVAGYGPSRGARRPQYAWFFAGDGLVAVDALLREGAYARARDELTFIMRYQNKQTGAIWHELSQSAGFLDWEHAYPYMFVHVDVSFDFLNTLRDYVETTGDFAFAKGNWDSIRAAYEYCRSTIPRGGVLPEIPSGQQGRDEQDPQRDELSLSLAWLSASESFAKLARLTGHDSLAAAASMASVKARTAIRPSYYDVRSHSWISGHLRSGARVEGLTASLTSLLHHGLLNDAERGALLDQLASPAYRAPWGIRSTPNNSPPYDPDSYARGSVWAIGTADAAMSFYEGGRDATAAAIWRDLVPWFSLDSPGHMPEVLRGDVFAPERESVPDQTWSSAAFISSAMRGMLGLRVDAEKRELRFAPRLPQEWDSLRVQHIDLGVTEVNLVLRRSPGVVELDIENQGAPMTLAFSPGLSGSQVDRVDVAGGARLTGDPPPLLGRDLVVLCASHDTCHVSLHLAVSH